MGFCSKLLITKNAALESQAIRKVAMNNIRNPFMQFLLRWNFSFCIMEGLSQSCYLSVFYQTDRELDFCLVICCVIHALNVQAGTCRLQKKPGLGHVAGLFLPMNFTEVPFWCSCHLTSPLAMAHWGIIGLFCLEDGRGSSWTVMGHHGQSWIMVAGKREQQKSPMRGLQPEV